MQVLLGPYNATRVGFFGTPRSEFSYMSRLESVERLQAGIRQYIHYYNHERIRTKLKDRSPVQYRTPALAA
ncbi:IS3 family transposase [Castellaniella sp. UC4442_H9]